MIARSIVKEGAIVAISSHKHTMVERIIKDWLLSVIVI